MKKIKMIGGATIICDLNWDKQKIIIGGITNFDFLEISQKQAEESFGKDNFYILFKNDSLVKNEEHKKQKENNITFFFYIYLIYLLIYFGKNSNETHPDFKFNKEIEENFPFNFEITEVDINSFIRDIYKLKTNIEKQAKKYQEKFNDKKDIKRNLMFDHLDGLLHENISNNSENEINILNSINISIESKYEKYKQKNPEKTNLLIINNFPYFSKYFIKENKEKIVNHLTNKCNKFNSIFFLESYNSEINIYFFKENKITKINDFKETNSLKEVKFSFYKKYWKENKNYSFINFYEFLNPNGIRDTFLTKEKAIKSRKTNKEIEVN